MKKLTWAIWFSVLAVAFWAASFSVFGQSSGSQNILLFQLGMNERNASSILTNNSTGEVIQIFQNDATTKQYQGKLPDGTVYATNLLFHKNQLVQIMIMQFFPVNESGYGMMKPWTNTVQNYISQIFGPMKAGDDNYPAWENFREPLYNYGIWNTTTVDIQADIVLNRTPNGYVLMPTFTIEHKQLYHNYLMDTNPKYAAINAPRPAPTPSSSGSPSGSPSSNTPTLQGGTYRRSDIRGHELVLLSPSSVVKQVTYRIDRESVAQGQYTINGNILTIEYTMFYGDSALRNELQGKKMVYTITSDRTFSGNGQSWSL